MHRSILLLPAVIGIGVLFHLALRPTEMTRPPSESLKPATESERVRPAALPYFWLQNDEQMDGAYRRLAAFSEEAHLAIELTFCANSRSATELIDMGTSDQSSLRDRLIVTPPVLTRFLVEQGPAKVRTLFKPVAVALDGTRKSLGYRIECSGEYHEARREPVTLVANADGSVELPTGTLPLGSTLYFDARFATDDPPPPVAALGDIQLRVVGEDGKPGNVSTPWQALTTHLKDSSRVTSLRLTITGRPPTQPIVVDLTDELGTLCHSGTCSLRLAERKLVAEAPSLKRAIRNILADSVTIRADFGTPDGPVDKFTSRTLGRNRTWQPMLAWAYLGDAVPPPKSYNQLLNVPSGTFAGKQIAIYVMLARAR